MIELVDFNEHMLGQKAEAEKASKTTRRSRRVVKKQDETPVSVAPAAKEEIAQEVTDSAAEQTSEENSSDENQEETK